jgi:dienelactone hydrolase
MKRVVILIFLMVLTVAPAGAAIQAEEVQYTQGDVTLKGYLAYDDSIDGKRPGVLIVHEWWGHNPYVRGRAEMLAELGYTALALDMYGDGKLADHPDTAGEFAGEVGKDLQGIGKDRFLAAMALLKRHDMTDPDHIAAIGYCFGGGVVLHMARYGLDLDGVVSFHGSIATVTPAQPGAVKARVLVYNGADDSFVTAEQIAAFKKEMEEAGADYEFVNLEGAVHSFTNPDADMFARKFGMNLAYNEAADKESWAGMQAFFNQIFKP